MATGTTGGAEPRPRGTDTAGWDDRELLRRHVAGDPDAFGELVRRHRDRLWAVAIRTLGDREEAADAVQDALISAYRSAHTFQGRSAVTTWLHRITVNACLDRARKAASRRAALTDDTERLEHLLEPHESAAVPAERQDLHRQLISALRHLPEEQRAALVLVDMQGYPVAEAAEVLEVAVGTVKSRCARGRARLLPLLSHLRADRSPAVEPGEPGGSGPVEPDRRGAAGKTGKPGKPGGPGAPAQPDRPTEPPGAQPAPGGRNQAQGASVPAARPAPGRTRGKGSGAVKGGGGQA